MPEGGADSTSVTTGLGSRGRSEGGPVQRDAGVSETAQTVLPSSCLYEKAALGITGALRCHNAEMKISGSVQLTSFNGHLHIFSH